MNHYECLRVPSNASQEEIQGAFKRLAHAVNTPGEPEHESAKRNAIHIAKAYRTLCDPERRTEYDRQLEQLKQQSTPEPTAIPDQKFCSRLEPRKTSKGGIAEAVVALLHGIFIVCGVLLGIAIVAGLIWLLVTIIHWFWTHPLW